MPRKYVKKIKLALPVVVKQPVVARPNGRPSLYRPEYCERIIEVMKTGLSVAGFAGTIGVSREAIAEWANRYPEFLHALHVAKAGCALHWERLALRTGQTSDRTGNPAMIMFALRNMAPADWMDKSTVALTGEGGGPIRIEESRDELIQSIMVILDRHAIAESSEGNFIDDDGQSAIGAENSLGILREAGSTGAAGGLVQLAADSGARVWKNADGE